MKIPNHPALNRYWPSERRAIWEHKYFLGLERGCNPSIEEAIESWERQHASRWRSNKMRRDAEAQLDEIESYRKWLEHDKGGEVSFDEAARDWVENHENQWRQHWEETALADA